MVFWRRLINLFVRCTCSLEKQAKMAGVNMGDKNFINSHFWGSEPYLITIGSNCALTYGTMIHTHGGARVAYPSNPKFDFFGKVILGDYVYVGCYAQIMAGVTIGDHVLIAAGSIVTKSVPSNVVVAGNPAKIICTTEEFIANNRKYDLSTGGMPKDEKMTLLMSLSDDRFIKKPLMIQK